MNYKLTGLTAAAVLVLSNFAQAHIRPGMWMGSMPDGRPCGFVASATYYEGGNHPLNERVKINYKKNEFILKHPPVVKLTPVPVAHFNHDLFQSVVATLNGANAFTIVMGHPADKRSDSFPVKFYNIDHNWKSDTIITVECNNLTYRGAARSN